MAEKGILVADAATGESIACRDAMETDEAGNSRIVQLVDKARRIHGLRSTVAPSRLISADFGDTGDLLGSVNTISAQMADSSILVGDATHVVAMCLIEATASTAQIIVTPMILDPDVADPTIDKSVMAILEPKLFTGLSLSGSTADVFTVNSSTGLFTLSQPHIWPTFGAEKIAFHVSVNRDVSLAELRYAKITSDHLTVSDSPQPSGLNTVAAWTAYQAVV